MSHLLPKDLDSSDHLKQNHEKKDKNPVVHERLDDEQKKNRQLMQDVLGQ